MNIEKLKAKLRGMWRSRMMWLGLALTAISGIQPMLMNWLQFKLAPEDYALAGMIVGGLVMVLRWVTEKPLEAKAKPGGGDE